MMSLDEMKLAVCSKLPDLTEIDILNNGERVIRWRDDRPISWPTEGLQVCHEAEKVLNSNERKLYSYRINEVATITDINAHHFTCEQRLEALCRVWWPKRFE